MINPEPDDITGPDLIGVPLGPCPVTGVPTVVWHTPDEYARYMQGVDVEAAFAMARGTRHGRCDDER